MDEFDTLRKEVLGGDGTITAVDLATGKKAKIDVSKNVVSRSFQTKKPSDVLWDLLYLPQETPAIDVCRASEDEIQHLLLLARCQNTVVRGYRFEDLFPDQVVAEFRDDRGMLLPGMRIFRAKGKDQCVERQIYTPTTANNPKTVGDQKCYILYELVPKFAAWLASCFSSLCFYERQAETERHAEGEAFVRKVTEMFAEESDQSAADKASAAVKDASPSNFDPRDHSCLGCGGFD